jgi:hypothetical protein
MRNVGIASVVPVSTFVASGTSRWSVNISVTSPGGDFGAVGTVDIPLWASNKTKDDALRQGMADLALSAISIVVAPEDFYIAFGTK